jgi:hypothetical protein
MNIIKHTDGTTIVSHLDSQLPEARRGVGPSRGKVPAVLEGPTVAVALAFSLS